jgi:pyruvate,water dikinase
LLGKVGKDDIALAGGKGANLGELSRAGLPVPDGFVVTTRAYDAFVEEGKLRDRILAIASGANGPAALEVAAEEIKRLFSGAEIAEDVEREVRAAYWELVGDGGTPLAVRSSATAEDLPGASFAGQQETFLNVRGAGALLEAVRACWASLWTARAMAYRERLGIEPGRVSLAVVVQEMVEAEAAGILFTADPTSGRRDRVVINAAWGLGEAVVSGRVTPDTLTVDRASGRVVSRETADKEVMTVYAGSGTEERPVPEARRRRPVLDDETAAKLAGYGARIEGLYGAPQDVEWALAGGEVFVLQARPITALPEQRAEPTFDWSVPDPKGFYSRNSIVELLPDPLSPLFASLAAEPVARTMREIMRELVGRDIFAGSDIEFTTINGYAYYGMVLTPQATWRMVRVVPGAMNRMIIRQGGEKLWREEYRPRYAKAVEEWSARPPQTLPAMRLLEGVKELLYRGAQYYTGVQVIMPSAYISEALFAWYYDRLVRRSGDPLAQIFLLGFDSAPIRAEKSLYSLALWCRERPDLAAALMDTPSNEALALLDADLPPAGVDGATWREYVSRFREHLHRHGRMVYDLDFAKPVPADDPAPTFDALKYYLRGEGKDPGERQRAAAVRRDEATEATAARLDPARRKLFLGLLGYTRKYAPMREDALAEVGLAWPLMREMLFELGRRLVAANAIEMPHDVFWLEGDELQDLAAALDSGRTELEGRSEAVREREAEWRARKLATPPALLPKGKKLLGIDWESWMPARPEAEPGATIEGVGVSSGRVIARARVLRGPEDFGQMRPGEALVAGITTPAWTPLFAMAAAVVTDVGGPLSHGSIVAREYGIPAVLGTGVATRRITSGQMVRVDGDAGTLTLLDGTSVANSERPAPKAAARGFPGPRKLAVLALGVGAVVGAALWWRIRRRR